MIKKIVGGICAAICVLMLILVAAQVITWKLFWMAMILLSAVAYLVLPKMKDS
ncbi:MAG TPA: hypothetical protein VJJ82_02245 [Candidatus Nanoarchaeia archaeon]|nr:hypothetical protein [Candidatus Nanoarchaeia archaeon]